MTIESYAEWLILGGHTAELARPEGMLPLPALPSVGTSRKKRKSQNDYTNENRESSTFSLFYLFPSGTDSPLLHEDSNSAKKFRRRFRVPYSIFQSICADMRSLGLYVDGVDAKGTPKIQLELLVLASLRYIASGCAFDSLEELTCIDENTLRQFFHKKFCIWGADAAEEHIKLPSDEESLQHVMGLYNKLGLPGCAGSVDCVHVIWDKCRAGLKSQCKGKEDHPTLAFEVVSSHTKRILSVSQFFWGATNDKSIARMDEAIGELRSSNSFLGNVKWASFDRSGEIRKHRGAYFICDGGYHNWKCLMPPFKHQLEGTEEAAWSHHIESVRKDVECVFGILKKRFLILKHPVRLHYPLHIQNVFVTCGVLHNLLLDYDGYDDWEKRDEVGAEDIEHTKLEMSAIEMAGGREGFTRSEARNIRPTSFLFEEEIEDESSVTDNANENDMFMQRRSNLIEHYEYLNGKRALKISLR